MYIIVPLCSNYYEYTPRHNVHTRTLCTTLAMHSVINHVYMYDNAHVPEHPQKYTTMYVSRIWKFSTSCKFLCYSIHPVDIDWSGFSTN